MAEPADPVRPDRPGSHLLEVVAVMDRLRSPGGCPWDAEQTHTSLVPYLLEEAHEAVEAIETGDRDHLVEELGDVLLQVVFHARLGEEDEQPWSVDDVADRLVDKLRRRHPHVFADGAASSAAEVEAAWEQIKAVEKADRAEAGIGAGIPLTLPALERAQKVLTRMSRRGIDDPLPDTGIGGELLALVQRARAEGVSAEAELRSTLRELEQRYAGA